SSAVYMAGLATAQAVVALRGHHWVAVGWGLGFVVFVLATWLSSDDLFRRIEIGLVASSVSAFVVFAVVLRAGRRRRRRWSPRTGRPPGRTTASS
ncbi:MAG TPA: hypothetical protein PKX01_17705, partial [Rhodocyclaceae bacterium]|nr:hypothetical protein [Rhodocyclaceae bacterium]